MSNAGELAGARLTEIVHGNHFWFVTEHTVANGVLEFAPMGWSAARK